MQKNTYSNLLKAISIGDAYWQNAADNGLLDKAVQHIGNSMVEDELGQQFLITCSCSYLGLDTHPKILAGAIHGLEASRTLNLPISRVRIQLSALATLENRLSDHFGCQALTAMSCSAASMSVIPLLAAGAFTMGQKPLVIYDRFAHFSMNQVKAISADETEVTTCPHNDLDFIENLCKQNKTVAYIADGAYSQGGVTPIQDLLWLQEKYGLFLYFDDSHALSILGNKGEGFVYSHMGVNTLTDRTIIVCSLAKAFAANGGVIFMSKNNPALDMIKRFGGPTLYSQYINPATIGACMASLDIHQSPELLQRQTKLRDNLKLFDTLIDTTPENPQLAIRIVPQASAEAAVHTAKKLFNNGFYTSAVFFPMMPKGKAGLRVMIRADFTVEQIKRFCGLVNAEKERRGSRVSVDPQ